MEEGKEEGEEKEPLVGHLCHLGGATEQGTRAAALGAQVRRPLLPLGAPGCGGLRLPRLQERASKALPLESERGFLPSRQCGGP